MSTALSVNLNTIAHIRNRRELDLPNVARFGRLALRHGAKGLTVHPRPDERHIRRDDLEPLAEICQVMEAEFNIEGYPSNLFLQACEKIKPQQVTLVPDSPEQKTSDHGWDIAANTSLLTESIARIHELGARVSLFIDAEPEAAVAAGELGANRVELYTAPYAEHFQGDDHEASLERYVATATAATTAGLNVNAGHDLSLDNLASLLRAIPAIKEVSIGHALTAEALEFGFAETVERYCAICADPTGS